MQANKMQANKFRRLHSGDSPSKPVSLKWVPKGMDPESACRVAIRVPAYVEQRPDGKDDYHVTSDYTRVVNRDTFSWLDLIDLLKQDIVFGPDQELHVMYFDDIQKKFVCIDSDASLLTAFGMFWDLRRLAILVDVKDTGPRLAALNASNVISTQQSQVEQGPIQEGEAQSEDSSSSSDTEPSKRKGKGKSNEPNLDDWDDCDEIEYVGVDDEKANYRDLVSDDEGADADYYPDTDEEDKDPLVVDDEKGCEYVVHLTDLENPKIAEGVTFSDGTYFKRCIRQYVVLNEVELAVPYSESTRYRAYCKAKRCRWRIYASQLQDGRTWMIRKLPHKHTCASTGKFEHNCMATNHWFKDRVINYFRADPTIGAKALKEKLEEKYCIKISYYVAWDGRQMALDGVLGGWEDSFEHVFSWKREIETRSPRSIVEVDCDIIGGKHRFMGVDSTVLTGRWKGQLASAIAVDGHNWMYPVAYGVFGSETTEMNEACPAAMKWLADNHKLLWARSMFSHSSKCDYCTNNIAECFNSCVKDDKSLQVIDLMDKIRQMIMKRFCTRVRIAEKLTGKILPRVMKVLHEKSRNLNFSITKCTPMIGEVGGVNKDLIPWRFIVDLERRECSCGAWQMTGLPCVHGIAFIGTRRVDLEDFVDKYYSVEKFKAAYASYVCPLPDKTQWEPVNTGFKLLPPLLKRAAGRPRTRRIVGVEEGGSGTKRRQACKRCGGLGHLQKTCNETVLDPDAPPPASAKKRRRTKPKVVDLGPLKTDASKGKKKATKPRVVYVTEDNQEDEPEIEEQPTMEGDPTMEQPTMEEQQEFVSAFNYTMQESNAT
ncbi:hypothetical protein U9M48_027388 [Paspalum notatum var. saurae]|uniref:SWIM-type domain-containing protein n=1 Tax=Paspalum notatum var. saurae TaxID=547442 RepID=A0AAQ3TUM7_PASNO